VFLYNDSSGTWTTVVDENTPIPGGTGNFTSAGDPSVSGSHVLFAGNGTGSDNGLYFYENGVLSRLIAGGDMLDGKTVADAETRFPYGINGDDLAAQIDFTDGSSAIYLIRIRSSANPVPTITEWGLISMTLLLLTAGAVVIGRRRRPATA